MPMAVSVKFFASLREQLERDAEQVDASLCQTVADVWDLVSDNQPMPANLLAAVNLEYVPFSHRVEDGDEVAFYPPVTGG